MRWLVAVAVALAGCASYTGSARDFAPAALRREPGWIAVRGVPPLAQVAESDCGAAAIAMVIAHWTGAPPRTIAAQLRPAPPRGIAAGRLRDHARRHRLAAFLIQGEITDLRRELSRGRPVVVGLVKPQRDGVLTHYEVVVAIHPGRRLVVTLDPAEGWRQNEVDGFVAEWTPAARLTLVVTGPAN